MFKKKQETKQHKRFGSFAFFLAILAFLIFGTVNAVQLASLAYAGQLQKEVWPPLLYGFCSTLILLLSLRVRKLRIFIHETKHALAVALTGNKVTAFKVEDTHGQVSYQMYRANSHYEPFIMLAPYFLPLLSLPALIFCIMLERYEPHALALALAVTLAFDLQTGFAELHKYQSDLRALIGGFFLCALFLASFYLWWISTCLVWLVGGNAALLGVLALIVAVAKDFAAELVSHRQAR